MSRDFLARNYQQNSDTNTSDSQKKIDPEAQKRWINSISTDSGWGLYGDFARKLNEERGDRAAEYTVPKGWGLKKIADHFDVSIESLKEKNKARLKQWDGVEGFETGEVIIIPPKEFKKKEVPKDPKKEIQSSYTFYKLGQYNMPDFVRSILPYVKNNEQEIIGIIDKLSKYERDNFSYSLSSNSEDNYLASLDAGLLSRMVEELDTINSFSRESNLFQKKRIEKVLGKKPESIKKKEESKKDKGEERKKLALEAVNNKKDNRTYGWDFDLKKKGERVDCSYFIREVEATQNSEEARKLKQKNGYLTVSELEKYSSTFSTERFADKDIVKYGRGTQQIAAIFKKYSFYSADLKDVKIGDYVFTGKGTTKEINTISHIVIITKIEIKNGLKEYHFADSGVAGAKKNKKTGLYEDGNRSVRNDNSIDHKGKLWKNDYFKGVGR